jgi:hypothetical protein
MKPVVSVGSKPPSSSIEDCFSSYKPYGAHVITNTQGDKTTDRTDLIRMPPFDNHIALVQLQADDAVDSTLTGRDRADDELALGREPVAVVQDPAELDSDKLVSESTDVPIERETLDVHMGNTQDRGRRRLVAAARFDANETVLYNVDTTDTVLASECVESKEDVDRICVLLLLIWNGDFDGKTSFELDRDAFGGRRSIFGGRGELPHVIGRGGIRIFEDTGLIRNMKEIFVGRPGLSSSLLDGDLFLSSVLKKGLATSKAIVEIYYI